MDETERALRAITCKWCKMDIPLSDKRSLTGKGSELHVNYELCTSKHAGLLPLFNASIVGAYAAAAKLCELHAADADYMDEGVERMVKAAHHFDAKTILALTPADARQASQQEFPLSEDVIKHRAEYPKAASDAWRAHKATSEDIIALIRWELVDCMYSSEPEAPKNGQKVDSWHAGCCALRAFAMMHKLSAAIASAEAQARLEEHLHYCDRCMLATPKDYCYRGKELYAAARTPDSTPKKKKPIVSPSCEDCDTEAKCHGLGSGCTPDSTKEPE